jgi:GNAT superfamily N-acetyltransferase
MSSWISSRLKPEHDLSGFTCGNEALDLWLKNHAVRADAQDTARTYVWSQDNSVIAFYSIAPTEIVRAGLPSSAAGGNSVIPAYLLARLALDKSIQGQGYGSQLLLDALEVIVSASRLASGRLIVVDAIDDAAVRFYEHHGFKLIQKTRRLFIRTASAKELFPESQPVPDPTGDASSANTGV